MYTPKDEKLSALGKQLSALAFQTPLSADSVTRLAELTARHTNNKIRSVCRVNSGTYLIQRYIGGRVRHLCSYLGTSDYMTIARVADMLTHTVGRYRLRTPRIPTPDEYNFSAAQAQRDLDNEAGFATVIKQIENHLREIGAFCDSAKKEVRENLELRQELSALRVRVEAIEKRFGQL